MRYKKVTYSIPIVTKQNNQPMQHLTFEAIFLPSVESYSINPTRFYGILPILPFTSNYDLYNKYTVTEHKTCEFPCSVHFVLGYHGSWYTGPVHSDHYYASKIEHLYDVKLIPLSLPTLSIN